MKYLIIFFFACSSFFIASTAVSGETSGHGPLGPVVKCETAKQGIKYIPVTYCKMFDGKVL